MGYRRTRTRIARTGALAAVLALSAAALAASADSGAAAQDAATQRQNERTDRINRAAAVPDEASAARAHPAAGTGAPPAADTRTSPTPLSYGPVLTPRDSRNVPPAQDLQGARKDPAEVNDEADTLARPTQPAAAGASSQRPVQPSARPASGSASGQASGSASGPASGPAPRPTQAKSQGSQPTARDPRPSNPQLTDEQREEGRRRAARRRPAYQGEGPMAPRPLRAGETPPAFVAEPVPAPLPAPQPVVPSSSAVRACQGIACTDAAGNTFNGSGNAGVGSGGRMCARTGATVQCF